MHHFVSSKMLKPGYAFFKTAFFFFLRIDLCVVLSLVAYLLMHEEAS